MFPVSVEGDRPGAPTEVVKRRIISTGEPYPDAFPARLTRNVDCSKTSSPFHTQTTLPSSACEIFSPFLTATAVYLCLCFPFLTTELASPALDTAG